MNSYNDYYLIYLIRTGHEEAYEYLLKKYSKVFYCKLEKYSLNYFVKVELVDEGLTELPFIVEKYDQDKGNFYSFAVTIFNRLVTRLVITDLKKNINLKKYFETNSERILYDSEMSSVEDEQVITYFKEELSEIEFEILFRCAVLNQSADVVADKLGVSTKKVYNVLYKVKSVAKDKFKD